MNSESDVKLEGGTLRDTQMGEKVFVFKKDELYSERGNLKTQLDMDSTFKVYLRAKVKLRKRL